MQETIGDG